MRRAGCRPSAGAGDMSKVLQKTRRRRGVKPVVQCQVAVGTDGDGSSHLFPLDCRVRSPARAPDPKNWSRPNTAPTVIAESAMLKARPVEKAICHWMKST